MPHARLRLKRKLSYDFSESSDDNSRGKKKFRTHKENQKRKKHRMRCQQYRANLTDEQRARSNKQSKKRMEKYRQRKKIYKDNNLETRQQVKHNSQQRIVWQERKAIQRASMTEQQRQAANKKRREQYKAKKLARGITVKFPAEAKAFAEKVDDLFASLSPRKKAAVKEKGFVWGHEGETLKRMESNLQESISTIKGTAETPKRSKFATVIKSIGGEKVDERLRKNFNIHYCTWKKHSLLEFERKKRSDSISDAAELEVQQFYSNHATIVAGVQGVTQDGTAKKVLQRTTQKIHREFSTEVGSKISLRKFQSMRPGFVMLANSNKFNTSLCEYCVNFEEKIQSVSSQAARMGLSELSSLDKYDVINMTLCPRNSGDYHKLACLERKCDQCGPEKLNILVLDTQDKILNWKRWETEKFVTKSQDGAELNAEGESKKGENKCKEAKPSKTITKKCSMMSQGTINS